MYACRREMGKVFFGYETQNHTHLKRLLTTWPLTKALHHYRQFREGKDSIFVFVKEHEDFLVLGHLLMRQLPFFLKIKPKNKAKKGHLKGWWATLPNWCWQSNRRFLFWSFYPSCPWPWYAWRVLVQRVEVGRISRPEAASYNHKAHLRLGVLLEVDFHVLPIKYGLH